MALILELPGPEDTRELGRLLGRLAVPGTLVRLLGPLGAGKTALVQGIALGLGLGEDAGVRSPSFALVRSHEGGRLPLVHVDLYRLGDPEELVDLGLDEVYQGSAVIAVEWADRFDGGVPQEGWEIRLEYADDGSRVAEIRGDDSLLCALTDATTRRSVENSNWEN